MKKGIRGEETMKRLLILLVLFASFMALGVVCNAQCANQYINGQFCPPMSSALSIRTVSANTTLNGAGTTPDYTVKVNAASAAITVTLPTTPIGLPAATSITGQAAGQILNIIKTDSSANVVTITAQAGATINGAATLTISTQYAAYQLQWDPVALTWTVL